MEKTLQQQYNLIKEGRGNKDDFLKSARRVFPEFISPLTNYTDAVTILKGKSILSEENIIKILKHFFSSEIVEDKFVLNVISSIWNKSNDIEKSISYIKEQIKENHKLSLISFDDLYGFYNKYCSNNSIKFVVSKRYFEKYLYFKFSEYIVYEKFIKLEWVDC
jgi:hypothetical protein